MTVDHSRPLNRSDYRTLALSSLGGTLEYYDFIIYVFFATAIGQVFFPPHSPEWLVQLQAYGIFAAGYLARPLGGVIMAHFGDQHGRKRMFTLSILLMALPTFLMGLLPTYETIGVWAPILLLLMRILQGAAVGGEIPSAWAFVTEHAPAKRTGFACGVLTGGLTSGILLGALVASAIHSYYSPTELLQYGWRTPFLLGGIFGLISVYLRSYLQETPVFKEMAAQRRLSKEWPVKRVLTMYRSEVLLSILLTWFLTAGIVVVILMTPPWLGKLPGIGAEKALWANCLAVLCLSIGCAISGSLCDRFGGGPTLFVGAILFMIGIYSFYNQVTLHPSWLFPGYPILGLLVGIVSTVPFIMVRAFPAMVRVSGISFSFNVSYAIFGGLTPIIVSLMLKSDSLALAHYVEAVVGLAIVMGLVLCVMARARAPKSLQVNH